MVCPNDGKKLLVRVSDKLIVRYHPDNKKLSEKEWEKFKNKEHNRFAKTGSNVNDIMLVCKNCTYAERPSQDMILMIRRGF